MIIKHKSQLWNQEINFMIMIYKMTHVSINYDHKSVSINHKIDIDIIKVILDFWKSGYLYRFWGWTHFY